MTDEQDPKDRPVTIDIETATETVTMPEDIERVRREAGLEEGDPPPRSISQDVGENVDEHGDHDHLIDDALEHRDGPQPG